MANEIYRLRQEFSQQGLGIAQNIYWLQNDTLLPPTDSQLLDAAVDYMEAIYAPLLPHLADTLTSRGVVMDEVGTDGKVIRTIGSRSTAINGESDNDPLALTTAGSGFVRTNAPKARGGKRFPGIREAGTIQGLFTNTVVTALAAAVLEWLTGDGIPILLDLVTGILSITRSEFIPFSDSAVVTNVPGTQVTRKPLRGQ